MKLEHFSWQRSPGAKWSAIHLRRPGEHRTLCGRVIPSIRYDDSHESVGGAAIACVRCGQAVAARARQRSHGQDFRVENHGSIVLLRPLTPAATAWVEEHLPAERRGWAGTVVVEHRFIEDIVSGFLADGLSCLTENA